MASERRRAPRYPIIADAEVTEIASETKLSARTSDLSAGGCFLDMLNPSPEGTEIAVRISHADTTFTARGRVVFLFPKYGNGCHVHERPGQSAGRSGKMACRVESRRMMGPAWKHGRIPTHPVSLLVAAAAGQAPSLQRVATRGSVEVFSGTQTLDRVPGFAVLLGEQLVGFGVIQELLVVAVPAQLASQLEGDVGNVRGAGGAVGGLHVGVGLMA
jgi:hypothetical protein